MDAPRERRGQRCCEAERGRKEIEGERAGEVVGWESGGRGRVAGTLDSSPHRHADLNGGLAPGARH